MHPVLVSVGQQFHLHQGRQRHDMLARFQELPLIDRRGGQGVLGPDLFTSPD